VNGLAITALALLFSSLVQSDLAELARKEKERRAKLAKPTKVLTEKDGQDAAAKGTGSVTALGGAPADASSTTPSTSTEVQQASWKQRAEQARAAVASAQSQLAKMESDLTKFRSDLTPVSAAEAQDPLRIQKREARAAEMAKEVEAQKAKVVAAQKALAALEDQARREGVPAGWLR
jgi:hypothetical protein